MANAVVLKSLYDSLGLSVSAFEDKIGAGSGAVRKLVERNGVVTSNLLEKILRTYPKVSRTWLETGKGEMFLADTSSADGLTTNDAPVGPGTRAAEGKGAYMTRQGYDQILASLVQANLDSAAAARDTAAANLKLTAMLEQREKKEGASYPADLMAGSTAPEVDTFYREFQNFRKSRDKVQNFVLEELAGLMAGEGQTKEQILEDLRSRLYKRVGQKVADGTGHNP